MGNLTLFFHGGVGFGTNKKCTLSIRMHVTQTKKKLNMNEKV